MRRGSNLQMQAQLMEKRLWILSDLVARRLDAGSFSNPLTPRVIIRAQLLRHPLWLKLAALTYISQHTNSGDMPLRKDKAMRVSGKARRRKSMMQVEGFQ